MPALAYLTVKELVPLKEVHGLKAMLARELSVHGVMLGMLAGT